MKLQHFSVIFIIIIIPILMTISMYIRTRSDVIRERKLLDTSLMNATHDAILAFQLNTASNNYSTLQNSKMRDVSASINTFFNNLAVSMNSSGYDTDDLQLHTPAIVCTMYDGYYIYTKYDNQRCDPTNGKITTSTDYKYGLKPLTTYSCRYYLNSDTDFTVNYTLDNSITIIGTIGGTNYQKTGHLIQLKNTTGYDLTTDDNIKNYIDNNISSTLDDSEVLEENLIIITPQGDFEVPGSLIDDSKTPSETIEFPKAERFKYVVYNSQKIYQDIDPTPAPGIDLNNYEKYSDNTTPKFFRYSSEYKKDYIPENSADLDKIKALFNSNTPGLDYYVEAVKFSKWVNENLAGVTQEKAVDVNGNPISFASNLNNSYIFKTTGDNNPLMISSDFNEHRGNVIRYCIEENLKTVMKNYNNGMAASEDYVYYLPIINEEDWYKIENSICFVAFLQDMPLRGEIYSNYCVVSNNTNKETVGVDSIYILTQEDPSNPSTIEYHKPGCSKLIEHPEKILGASNSYSAVDFERKSIYLSGQDSNAARQLVGLNNKAHFYPQGYTACYDCIVGAGTVYSTDDILARGNGSGTVSVTVKNEQGEAPNKTIVIPRKLYQIYLRALARERYNLYTINGYFGN